jgi:hypothetical protein
MTLEMTIWGVATIGVVLLLALALTACWVARPWQMGGRRWIDQVRVADALMRYDGWLSLRDVPGGRRRDLRDELRANLWEATDRVGSRAAVKALGSLRQMAAEADLGTARPRWARGAVSGLLVLELVVAFQLLLATVWADAAMASHASEVSGPVTLIPGTWMTFARKAGGGFSYGMSTGPLCLVLGAVMFVAVARPWRAFTRPAGRTGR